MSRITQISLLILILGMAVGLFIGGFSGMFTGLALAAVIAILFYCMGNVFKANAISKPLDSFEEVPMQTKLDRSQLLKSAYEPNGLG